MSVYTKRVTRQLRKWRRRTIKFAASLAETKWNRESRRWFLKLRRYDHWRPTAALVVLCLFLVSFTSADQAESDTLAPSTAALMAGSTEQKDVVPQEPWDFFRPTWHREAIWNVLPVSANTFDSLNDTTFSSRDFVADPDNRIEDEFSVPSNLKSRVQFWVDIYSRFSSRTLVVHDRSNMDIIYGYIDLRPLYRTMGSAAAAQAKGSTIEKKIIKELKARIAEAAGLTNTNLLTLQEKEELRALISRAGALSPKGAEQLMESVRTQTGQSDMFLMALYRSKQLLPHIESVFRQAGLPVALGRIPFVESSFNARAESKIGALGIWQFTRETARQMISAEQEHLWGDPLRQTRSAVRLLRMYRNMLPDWGSTVTAYNSGVGRVKRLVEKFKLRGIEDLSELPSQQDTLGFAGKNFYSEFLAANIVEAYKEEIFQHLLTPDEFSLVFKEKGKLPKESCDL